MIVENMYSYKVTKRQSQQRRSADRIRDLNLQFYYEILWKKNGISQVHGENQNGVFRPRKLWKLDFFCILKYGITNVLSQLEITHNVLFWKLVISCERYFIRATHSWNTYKKSSRFQNKTLLVISTSESTLYYLLKIMPYGIVLWNLKHSPFCCNCI